MPFDIAPLFWRDVTCVTAGPLSEARHSKGWGAAEGCLETHLWGTFYGTRLAGLLVPSCCFRSRCRRVEAGRRWQVNLGKAMGTKAHTHGRRHKEGWREGIKQWKMKKGRKRTGTARCEGRDLRGREGRYQRGSMWIYMNKNDGCENDDGAAIPHTDNINTSL